MKENANEKTGGEHGKLEPLVRQPVCAKRFTKMLKTLTIDELCALEIDVQREIESR